MGTLLRAQSKGTLIIRIERVNDAFAGTLVKAARTDNNSSPDTEVSSVNVQGMNRL